MNESRWKNATLYIYIYIYIYTTTTTTVTHRVSNQTRPRTASGCSQVPGLGHLGWYAEQTGRGPLKEGRRGCLSEIEVDRKSTRLNSSHVRISYAVFCLKKKKTLQS